MSKPRIENGIYRRSVPVKWHGRTDIPVVVLGNASIHHAMFVVEKGPVVFIDMLRLKTVLESVPRRGTKVGPFTINWTRGTINGHPVPMLIIWN